MKSSEEYIKETEGTLKKVSDGGSLCSALKSIALSILVLAATIKEEGAKK